MPKGCSSRIARKKTRHEIHIFSTNPDTYNPIITHDPQSRAPHTPTQPDSGSLKAGTEKDKQSGTTYSM